MKKKILCFFSLLLYLLVACTLLSEKIEEEMSTLVEIELRTASGSVAPTSQSLEVLFIDEKGQHLYEVIDGTGWESGLRIREIPVGVWGFGYTRFGPYVEVVGGEDYRFVQSASRQPPDGKLATIVGKFETVEDQYLVIYSESMPEPLELPENSALSAHKGNILLLDMKQGELPFFEHKVKTLSDALGTADRVFSLTETAQFLNQMQAVMQVMLLIIFSVVLLGYSCILSIRAEEHKGLLLFNTCLIIASLFILQHTLGRIDLPASLLPAENILNIQHYIEEFSLIFDALEELEAADICILRDQAVSQSFVLFRNGIFVVAGVLSVESAALWLKALLGKRKKYIGKYLRK